MTELDVLLSCAWWDWPLTWLKVKSDVVAVLVHSAAPIVWVERFTELCLVGLALDLVES